MPKDLRAIYFNRIFVMLNKLNNQPQPNTMANFKLTAEEQQAYQELKEAREQAAKWYIIASERCAEYQFKETFGFDINQTFTFKGGKARYKAIWVMDAQTLQTEWRMQALDDNGEFTGKTRPLSPFDYKGLTIVE